MLRRLVTSLILAAALGAIILAFTLRGEDGGLIRHRAVEFLFPRPGALEVRQVEVGADLVAGWTGVLLIDGTEIPEDQLRRVDPQNQFFFQPGAGKEFEEFDAGTICATAVIWPVQRGREQAEDVRWCFQVA